MKVWQKNTILILLVILLAAAPLWLCREAEFGGADGMAAELVEESVPGFEPWFEPILEPASGEIESLLFALQAAVGSRYFPRRRRSPGSRSKCPLHRSGPGGGKTPPLEKQACSWRPSCSAGHQVPISAGLAKISSIRFKNGTKPEKSITRWSKARHMEDHRRTPMAFSPRWFV